MCRPAPPPFMLATSMLATTPEPSPRPQVWALARLVKAGRKEAVEQQLRRHPVGTTPILRVRDFNPATQLVDVREGEGGDAWVPTLDENGCTVHPPPRVFGVTTGLWEHPGGRVVSRCAAWPQRQVRAELIAYICHRLVDEGAAEPGIAPRCKHKISPEFVRQAVVG